MGHGFIVDFLAPALKLVVEVDGSAHEHRRRADARRDEKLRRLSYQVLRLEAKLVMADLDAAMSLVTANVGRLRRGQRVMVRNFQAYTGRLRSPAVGLATL